MKIRVVVAALLVGLVASAMPPEKPDRPVIELHRTAAASFFEPAKGKPLFVLILGSDVRQGDPRTGRADSIHLLALDPVRGRGTLVGFPRDSYVPVPGAGQRKINAALSLGGPRRLVETVGRLAGVRIQYWATVDFSRFRKLVDRVGGVPVRVPYKIVDQASGANFAAGVRHMNGVQALAFARVRKTIPGGDFERSRNQGRLLLAGLAKFRDDAGSPLQLARYLSAFNDLVASNVSPGNLIDLARVAARADPRQIANVVVPGSPGSAGGSSVVFLAPGANDIFRKIRDNAVL